MSIGTLIQWCYASVNFWWGCTKVSAGCAHCYAETMAKRLGRGRATWGPTGLRWSRVGEACQELLKLERIAVKKNTRLRIFINSMSDTFEDRRDLDSARDVLFAIAPCVPHLDLLLLTKRVECVEQLIPNAWKDWRSDANKRWPCNVWLGFSAEDQSAFNSRWPVVEHLGRRYGIPCLFCSAEPLLGPLDITIAQFISGGCGDGHESGDPDLRPLDWLIIGGESGQRARTFNVSELRATMKQAREFEIPVFVKQLGRRPIIEKWPRAEREMNNFGRVSEVELNDGHGGDMAEWPADLRVRELPQPSMLNGVQA